MGVYTVVSTVMSDAVVKLVNRRLGMGGELGRLAARPRFATPLPRCGDPLANPQVYQGQTSAGFREAIDN